MRRAPALLLPLILLTACARPATPPAGEPAVQARPEVALPADPSTTAVPPSPAPPRPAPSAVTTAIRATQRTAKAGVVVLDRESGAELVAENPDGQFRSASLVKLLMAIEVLADPAPQEADRKRIARMLSLSDDDIANALWVRLGNQAMIPRVAARLGLTRTTAPRLANRWGDVLLSAHDVVRVYQHVLALPPADRDLVVESLAAAPREAADGFDQHFGIPDGTDLDWAVKQGWSDSRSDIVLHSSGLVGPDRRYVVVVLTSHPLGVRWKTAANSVTAGVRALGDVLAG